MTKLTEDTLSDIRGKGPDHRGGRRGGMDREGGGSQEDRRTTEDGQGRGVPAWWNWSYVPDKPPPQKGFFIDNLIACDEYGVQG